MTNMLRRIGTLEAVRRARAAAMTLEELSASLDAQYGPGTGAFLWAYMGEHLSVDELEALHAGDRRLAQQVWGAYDTWRGTR